MLVMLTLEYKEKLEKYREKHSLYPFECNLMQVAEEVPHTDRIRLLNIKNHFNMPMIATFDDVIIMA